MHYYIDGYNLLFRLMHKGENLQDLREHVIQEINKKVSLVHLDVSIVFDAPLQLGEGSRSHYDAVEILFTAKGETADEFLISELRICTDPHQETIVTSDKKLAWRARHKSAHTQSVEEFIDLLNRMYKNKLKQLKKPQPAPRKSSPLINPAPQKLPSPAATPEESADYYERVFQDNFEKILLEEEKEKAKQPLAPPKRKPKQPKKSLFPPDEIKKEEDDHAMERWLKIFEYRAKEESG
jgi:uncharacterized protein